MKRPQRNLIAGYYALFANKSVVETHNVEERRSDLQVEGRIQPLSLAVWSTPSKAIDIQCRQAKHEIGLFAARSLSLCTK